MRRNSSVAPEPASTAATVVVPAEPAAMPAESAPPPAGVGAVVKAYVALTKPRIIELLLITTVPAMLLAARQNGDTLPSVASVIFVVIGGAMAAGSANALNCYIDRDIDQLMRRTSSRPLPQHTVSPRSALVFGLVMGTLAVGGLWLTTNALAAILTAAAIAYYDIVYTMVLKRRTAANTVWGGVCGAAPVLIGWAAVTGGLSLTAWLLFAVVFFWQPPHFWALAIKFKDDYAAAGIPMLPVVASLRRVSVESIVYVWLTVAASIAIWPLATTPLYAVAAAGSGALFILEAHRMDGRVRRGEPIAAMRLFHWSITYLTLVFIALAIDTFLQ